MKYRHLTQVQRFIIEEMLVKGQSYAAIARSLSVHRSTISREVKRNRGARGYFGKGAQASMRSRRPCLIEYCRKIEGKTEELVIGLLKKAWSPEQISQRLKMEKRISISHESIYRFLLFDQRCGGRLYKLLRRSRAGRRKYRRRLGPNANVVKRSISERPQPANDRSEIGHWERDLVCDGRKKAALLTIVDRKSRFTKIEKVFSFRPDDVNAATTRSLQMHHCLSITNDNGLEFAKSSQIEDALKTRVYFTHPYSSWERGTVENTNGLLRQFFPKGLDLSTIEEWKVKKAETLLNNRPRKTLGWKTPNEIYFGIETKLIG